ncbi:amidohydrolase family protein [Echinicola jeungdonensis]|uniref:Amidohydrolase family protein n=1 Tax=Echinicola jeungdonensis TaxID=709343 RepID=A0ABV5J747_9BACT|nr:amidohydrolase family protein [Echinicola jeungdonensis]MDN3670846.1 amidohydrolase family protein [Echinicola jeungdonensis]
MLRIYFILGCFLYLLFPGHSWGQIEGEIIKAKKGKFLLRGGTVITVTQGTFENTSVLLKDGKILEIGKEIPTDDVEIIPCEGQYIYPGFIDAGTRLGLVEIGSLSETRDYKEIGKITPQMEALNAINPNSVSIPITRVSGVTTVLTFPSGGLFPGTASLINLNGYTPEQMFAGFKGVVLEFPSSERKNRWDRRTEEEIKKELEKEMKSLNEIWEKAMLYQDLSAKKAKLQYYPEMSHLAKVVNGEFPLLIEVNKASDIIRAIKWVKDKKVKAIFMGVAEGWRVAEKIATAEIPVIIGPVLSLPPRQSDRYDAAYTNPGELVKAGVKVALRTSDAENVRNLPFNAGFAANYGMGKESALKAITIVPAEIFGVDDQLGSIEPGKSATLFISNGDPFEPQTKIKHVFIEGYKIPMTNRQIRLYQEFLERQPGLVE